MLVGLPHQQLRIPPAIVQGHRLLPLLRSIILHQIVAPLLLENTVLLHLLSTCVLGAEKVVLSQVAGILLYVDSIAVLVIALHWLLFALRCAAYYLVCPSFVQSLYGRVWSKVRKLACTYHIFGLIALPEFAFLHNFVDKTAILLQAELGVVTDFDPYLWLALNDVLFVEELSEVGMLSDFKHAGPLLRIEAQWFAEQVVALGRAVADPLLAIQWLYLR